MSNPNLVEGIYFTMYPNEILEAINQSNMTKTQIKICNHIIRQTFGWHKSWAIISHEDFAYACAPKEYPCGTPYASQKQRRPL